MRSAGDARRARRRWFADDSDRSGGSTTGLRDGNALGTGCSDGESDEASCQASTRPGSAGAWMIARNGILAAAATAACTLFSAAGVAAGSADAAVRPAAGFRRAWLHRGSWAAHLC